MIIPATNMAVITMNEPIDKRAIPEMPLPLVQPSARRAPIKKIKPPMKAMMSLGHIDDVLRIVVQSGEIESRVTPERRLERYAPSPIPMTSPSCHQFFNIGKHLASPPWPSIQRAIDPNDPDVPIDAPRMRKTGI